MEIAKRTAMDDYLDMYESNLQSAIQRAEAAEARAAALEKERDELRAASQNKTIDIVNQLIPCEVIGCTARGAQLHHLAPRNKFDGTCDLWPTMYLCHYHHVEWHWRVEGLNLDNEIVTRIRGQS